MNSPDILSIMGKIICVDAIYTRNISSGEKLYPIKKCWTRNQVFGRPGWVVGSRWIQNGIVYYDTVEGPYWECTSRVPCILVSFWPTQQAQKVPVDAFRLPSENVYPYHSTEIFDHKYREYMRSLMTSWPRAKDGRWLPKKK